MFLGRPHKQSDKHQQMLGEIHEQNLLKWACHGRKNAAVTLELPEVSGQGPHATLPSVISLEELPDL